MRLIRPSIRLFALSAALLASAAWAQAGADATGIRAAAEAEAMRLAATPGMTVSASALIDDRVAMPACARALETRQQSASGSNLTIAVSCSAPQRWTLYVPVRLQKSTEVLTLLRPLPAHTTITADMLTRQTRDVSRLPYGYLSDTDTAIGQVTRRALHGGSVLGPRDLQPPNRVRRGEAVTLVSRAGAVEVRMRGKALADAAVNQPLRVENRASRRVLQGIVRADGTVIIGQP